MLAAEGVHPLVLRRRKVFRTRQKPALYRNGAGPAHSGLTASVLLVMLFLVGFAYGLRWIDQRFARPNSAFSAPVETSTDDIGPSENEWLSDALRGLFGIRTVYAAHVDASRYFGAPARRVVSVEAAPGETVTVPISVKNLGSTTWTPEGRRYVSAYTIQPRYHASVFRSRDWISSSQTPRLATASVKKGETGELRLTLTAPKKTGVYSDTFQLASEDTSWIWGAFFTVKMNVRAAPIAAAAPPAALSSAAPVPDEPAQPAPEPLKGYLVFRSAERLEAPGGTRFTARLIVKNGGASPWKRWGLRLASAAAADGSAVEIADADWAGPDLTVVKDEIVMPNQNADFLFPVTLPAKRGEYRFRFVFVADGSALESAPIEFPVTVMSDAALPAPAVPSAPETPAPAAPQPGPSAPAGDPLIRVGLYTTEKFEEISFDGPYEIRDAGGGLLGNFPAGTRLQFRYDAAAALYRATNGIADVSSALPIRFASSNAEGIFTLWSHEDRPSWNPSINYNRYRGVLEMRKNDRNAYVWLINELPMERYLKGMKETSNASPIEFQKALVTAARSYAYWHLTHPGKHWHFTVDATYDQVYKGYVAETQIPKLTAAADATRGQVVTYQGEAVVTPYFTWSDGRTRAWTEVWGGGAKPWLVSVPATYDAAAGRSLFGHGVGMSAWDAIGRANAGEMYDAILRYYYQGTELKKVY